MKKKEKRNNLGTITGLIIISLMLMGFLGVISDDIQHTNSPKIETAFKIPEIDKSSSIYEMLSNGYSTYPPDPTPYILTQPDGTTFKVRNVGERIGGHVEILEGYTIMKDDDGWWTFATKDEEGYLEPTDDIVGEIDPESISNLQKHLANDYPEVEDNSKKYQRGTRAPPTNSTWRAIAIMLNFTDETFDPGDKSAFELMLNGTSGQTMRTYYREVSYNQFDIELDVVGPFDSVRTMSYYGADVGPNDSNPNTRDDGNVSVSEMAKEAVQLADPTVDFTKYDVDSDGAIDALFVIHAGPGQEGSGPAHAIWSHMSFIGYMTNDGVMATRYSTEPENGKVGVFAHEFGHVLGLPDLYDTDYSSSGIGRWGVMAGGSWNGAGNSPAHFSAWCKIALGWVEPIIVTSDVSLFQIEVVPVWNNTVIYKIWAHDPAVNPWEYFLVENRQKEGYDSALPGEGILIWHVDELVGGNQDETHYKVDLEEADGAQELETPSGPSQSTDPWKNNVTGFRNNTTPNSSAYNGNETGVWVWNFSVISADGNMSIGFMEIYEGPEEIYIADPQTNGSILPVYDFILNDTGFPDEDVGWDNDGNNGSFILEWRQNGTSNPWNVTPAQTMISWEGGKNGTINCTLLTEGFWDFRVKIMDEEGHLYYTPEVYNVAIPTKIPPVADAGPDNTTDVLYPTLLDGSGSTDNSGFIAWFNWTFDDGTYLNGTNSIVFHNWSDIGIYNVTLNVTDSFGNYDIDIVNITVIDSGSPVTQLIPGNPSYRGSINDGWNVTSNTFITLSSWDNYAGVNFTWYTIDGVYFNYTTPFKFTGYSEGPHNFAWGAEDNFGNNETGNEMVILIDNTAPDTTLIIGDPKYKAVMGDLWNVTNTTLFTIISWDEHSGIDYTWYSIDSNFFIGSTFTLDGYLDGLLEIIWSTADNLGNYLDKNITINLDTTAPTTDIQVAAPRYRNQIGDRWNVTTLTQININNETDGTGSGLNFTWYTIDGFFYMDLGPFTLTPGLHVITWGSIDNLGLNESGNTIEIFVDDLPPISSLNIGTPKYSSSPTYVDSTTLFTISATDGMGSGIESSWYQIDAGGWTRYMGTFNVLTSGPHTIYYNSTDNLGFTEITKSIDIIVDNLPPDTSILVGSPNYGTSPTYVDSTTLFTLSSTDGAGSGVASIWLRIDMGSWVLYPGDFSISSAGPHTIYYYATDNLGHDELIKSLDIFVDDPAPITTLTVGDPKAGSSPVRVGISTPFNLTATDGVGCGVASIWYNLDAAGWVLYTGNFTISTPGDHTIYFYSSDNLGHNEFNQLFDVFVDTSPPSTTLNIGDPKFSSSPTYVDSSTIFNLTSNDGPGTGVASIWYKLNSGSWILYTGNFTISTQGAYTISYYAVDMLGQTEITKTEDVYVDTEAPVTSISVGDPKFGSSPTYVNTTTEFTLSASDGGGSGVVITWYKIGSSVWITYTGPFMVVTTGSVTITYYSRDNLDHVEIDETFDIYVDVQAPTSSISVGIPKYSASPTYVNSTTPFNITASDGTGSGIASIWYKVDSAGSYNLYTGDFYVSSPEYHDVFYYSKDNLGYSGPTNSISIYVDLTPPVTTLSIGQPKYGISPVYVNLGTEINLQTTDGTGSGVDSLWYKIDSGSFQAYSSNFTLPSSGSHTISYYADDLLGQSEIIKSIDLICDPTPPLTNLTINDPKYRDTDFDLWNVTSETLFELSTGSLDISETWFTINGKYYEDVDFTLGYFNLPEGFYTLTWGSIDKLLNNETGNSQTVFLDTSTPTTGLTVGNPKYRENPADNWKVTKATDFYLYSPYQKSGVKATWYIIDGDYNEGTKFDLSIYNDGSHTITWGSVDNLGHNETANQITVILDSDLVFIDLVLGDPKYRAEDTDLFNITIQTPFTLTTFDQYLDVAFVWFEIDGDYYEDTSFTLDGYSQGLHTITFGTEDNIGTTETWDTILVYLDNSPPITDIEISEPNIQEGGQYIITKDTEFTLSAIDEYSGVALIWYRVDGEYFEGTTFDLDGFADGTYQILWGSEDNLNFIETENELNIVVDNNPPIINIQIGAPNATVNDVTYITSKTKITLISEDSDTSTMYYSTDGGATFNVYTSPFTVAYSTTEIVYYGEDLLVNLGDYASFELVVNDKDTDEDGTEDLIDMDDDNDNLLDTEEDINQNGILDEDESDPLNPDTDSDGKIDSKDKYPQDASKYRDPTDWEKIPVLGGFEQSLCINLFIIGIIVLVLLLYLFRRYRMHRAKSSWEKESENELNPPNNK